MFARFDTTENTIQSGSLDTVMYLFYILSYPYFVGLLTRVVIWVLNVVWFRRVIRVNNLV